MARLTQQRREEIKSAIHEHLNLVGPKGWDEVLARFPDTSSATFHRMVKEVRESITLNASAESPAALRIAQRRIQKMEPTVQEMQAAAGQQLPCAPSPAIIAGLGSEGPRAINIIAKIDRVFADGEMLRSFSVLKGEDGVEKIKNPIIFAKSAKLRLETIAGYLQAMAQTYNFERIQDLYDILLDEIGKASPEVQYAILMRLKAANNSRGMTVSASI